MSRVREELINRVFTQSRLQNLLNKQKGNLKLSKNPLITIARDPGSGGRPIAKLTAKKLRFKFFDESLVEAIAKSARKRKQVIARVDEKTRNAIQDTIHSLFNPEYISDTTYIKHLTNTVLSIAHQGKAVIVGRGANFIVPKDDALNVLVTAPLRTCIHRAKLYEKISHAKAQKTVLNITKQRKKFVSQYFNKNYTNAIYYDLVLNTHYFDVEASSNIIISAFRKKFPTFKELVKSTLKKTGRLY